MGDYTAPAGNTFEFDCAANAARHMHVNADANVNPITYWHHAPNATVQVIPTCRDIALAPWPTSPVYVKEQACPTSPNAGLLVTSAVDGAVGAHHELAMLEEVYRDWSDGGDFPGLKDFVMDSTNSSYAVRNALMSLAPKVSKGIWELVFFSRKPELNPWHLAQALLANSPLEAQVLLWLDTLDVNPFYKELVLNGQNGGMSMHTLYQTDIEQFYSRKADLLTHALGRVLQGEEPGKAGVLLAMFDSLHTVSSPERKLALQLALGDLQNARSLVLAMRTADSENGYWKVQDMLLRLKEESKACTELTAADQSLLEAIAANGKDPGQADAQAWLTFLGAEFEEDVEFPTEGGGKLLRRDTGAGALEQVHAPLRAYPNPTDGPLYLVYTVPEGVEQAELRVIDAAGREVYRQRVAPQNGIAEIMLGQAASGMHVAMLLWDGIRVGAAKVSLMR